jgi:S1-C subfamily serine protease
MNRTSKTFPYAPARASHVVATLFPMLALLVLAAWRACAFAATADDTAERSDAAAPATVADAGRVFSAVVRVSAKAVPDARSAPTLGTEREGSGIVIGADGLILTIGYLIVEADSVQVTDAAGRSRPARVLGYDHTTGLGLLKTLVALDVAPLAFGDSERLAERDPVMIVNHGGRDEMTLAYVVSRRTFTGNWEYMLDRAIYTSPPAMNWSGAALVDRDGRLLGVGSLIVREVSRELQVPGNVFVPIDLLKPILSDLVERGRRAGPARPWLGIAADELQGRLFVTRVSPDGPADRAGLQQGDIVLAVGTAAVKTQADFYRRLWASGDAGAEITLRVLQGADLREVKVRSIDRTEYFRAKPTL